MALMDPEVVWGVWGGRRPDLMYLVSISAVDGETEYSCETPDPGEGLRFLALHDHEGSAIGLTIRQIVKHQRSHDDYFYGEQVYRRLERASAK